MKQARIIIRVIIFMTLVSTIQAQDFADIQQYATPILLNPSFAGSTRGDRLWVSLQSTHNKDSKAILKFISHDFYNKKRAMGFGIIGGVRADYKQNLYIPFIEASISKYIPQKQQTILVPSLTFGFHQPLKEYSLFLYDQIINPRGIPSYPGYTLYRTTELSAGSGILLTNYEGSIGVSGKVRWSYKKNPYTDSLDEFSYSLLIHAEKIFTYHHRGLLSREYLFRPRFVLHMKDESIQLFSEIMVNRKQFETGIGFLPNFNTGNTRLSVNVGYNLKYFKINYIGSILNENGAFKRNMHNIYLSVILPKLKRYGIPVPALIRNL